MHRRRFLQIASTGSLAVALPGTTFLSGPNEALQALATPRLLSLLGSPDAVRDIGRSYRAQYPSERTVAGLQLGLGMGAEPAPAPKAAVLREHLHRRVQMDFERGDTIRIKGWMLSRTEARQCALFSLVSA